MLRKDTAFTLVAVLSLALGTGANASMFSFVNGILLRPLAVYRPSEVLTIAPAHPESTFSGLSYPDYLDYRDRTQTMKDLVASTLFRFGYSRSAEALPQVKYGLVVSGNLFQAMGVVPILGRAFRPDEDKVPGRDAVVILGHDFWRDEFASDPKVIGRTIRINGLDFSVIGVLPETFTSMDEFFKAAMFVPAMMGPRIAADPKNSFLDRRDWRDFAVRGRLKPGVTRTQADAELDSIAKGLEQTYPATNKGQRVWLRSEIQMHVAHMPQESGFMFLAVIMGALVLVISCFNVANLLLSRARTREIAVRVAVGAGRARLIRQLFCESLVLGIAGTAAGLWFAWIASQLFNRIKVPSDLPFNVDFHSDYRVLMFSLAAGFLSVIFFGLAPAWQSSKVDLVAALKSLDASLGSAGRHSWTKNLFVVGQIAISVVLLVAAAMVYRGFSRQLASGAGLRSNHILMVSFDPRIIRYDDERMKEFYRRLADQIVESPGVRRIAYGATMPFAVSQRGYSIDVTREGQEPSKDKEKDHVLFDIVDEHFFEAMAVPMLRGRALNAADTADSPLVTVVNEALANKYWPGENAIGKRIQIEVENNEVRWLEVVGVAQTLKYVWPTEAPAEYFYLPISQNFRRQRMMFVEAYGDPASLTGQVRKTIHDLEPNMPVFDVRTLEEYFTMGVTQTADVTLYIVSAMGFTGLALSMIGLYGLVSYSVSRRTREFGIRIAIGAGKASVLAMVLRQGTVLCLVGIITGISVSLPFSRLMQSVVFGATSDRIPYIAVPILLLMVTLAAIYGPAHRASRIDPMKALRDE